MPADYLEDTRYCTYTWFSNFIISQRKIKLNQWKMARKSVKICLWNLKVLLFTLKYLIYNVTIAFSRVQNYYSLTIPESMEKYNHLLLYEVYLCIDM